MFAKPTESIARFLRDESGQDLVEYALLSATIGLAGAAVWSVMNGVIADSYNNTMTSVRDAWTPPEPGAFSK